MAQTAAIEPAPRRRFPAHPVQISAADRISRRRLFTARETAKTLSTVRRRFPKSLLSTPSPSSSNTNGPRHAAPRAFQSIAAASTSVHGRNNTMNDQLDEFVIDTSSTPFVVQSGCGAMAEPGHAHASKPLILPRGRASLHPVSSLRHTRVRSHGARGHHHYQPAVIERLGCIRPTGGVVMRAHGTPPSKRNPTSSRHGHALPRAHFRPTSASKQAKPRLAISVGKGSASRRGGPTDCDCDSLPRTLTRRHPCLPACRTQPASSSLPPVRLSLSLPVKGTLARRMLAAGGQRHGPSIICLVANDAPLEASRQSVPSRGSIDVDAATHPE